ncbi:MAG: NAD-dependent epimerase/dehydratase family protein [Cyclobacteriaceae bacterium]
MIKIKGKNVFISGGNGVIGKNLVQRLHELGAKVLVGDLKPRPASWPNEILYRQGDLNYITKEELETFQPNLFFHLAATFERSTESYEFWNENAWHNVRLSTHLMTVLKDLKSLQKVIFASSYLIYDKKLYQFDKPAPKAVSLTETDPVLPRNLTGAAKLNHEIELRFLNDFKQEQFQSVSARIYRSYGKHSRDIISRWIRQLLKGDNTLSLYRKEGIFDYVFAEDVSEGLIRLAVSEQANGIVNLGRGNARRVEEVVEILKTYFPLIKCSEENIDIPYEGSQADMNLFRQLTGWAPEQDLEATIPKMIEHEKASFHDEDQGDLPAFNVLVTSASKKVPMLKALKKACLKLGGNIKLFAADIHPDALAKYFSDCFWNMPKTIGSNRPSILSFLLENKIKVIIPTRDGELTFWSDWKSVLLDHGIYVMVSSTHAVEICLDKLKFYEKLSEHSLPVIPTYLEIEKLKDNHAFVVKERFGAGSQSLGLNLNKEQALNQASKLENPIFQPFIPGIELSIDVFVGQNKKLKGVIIRSRDFVVNGESQITTVIADPNLEKLIEQAAKIIDLEGHAIFQVIKNEKGYHIIECNSRFGGASTLSIAAGLDTFYWVLLESTGGELNTYPFVKKVGVKQIRHAEDKLIE